MSIGTCPLCGAPDGRSDPRVGPDTPCAACEARLAASAASADGSAPVFEPTVDGHESRSRGSLPPELPSAGADTATELCGPPRTREAGEATVPAGQRVARADGGEGGVWMPFGRYRLLQLLGQGGMGRVFKAWDPELRRAVALKQVKHDGASDDEGLPRFLREARLAAKLRHPNIVAVYDVGAVDGRHFITMEYIQGRTLAAWLAETREARSTSSRAQAGPLRRGVELLALVAEAVAYAHAEGIVHRDLKPSNVLLDRSERPYVMDFGLAKEVSLGADAEGRCTATDLTRTGDVLGTPAYMSPEQASGEGAGASPATDVWALGVMLFELLTGRLPFEGGREWEILSAIVHAEPPTPHQLNPRAPGDLEAVALAALEKDPRRRYASAGEFAAELRRWLAGDSVHATRPGRAVRAWRWAARRRAVLAVAAGVVVTLGAAGAFVRHERVRRAADARAILAQVASSVSTLQDTAMKRPIPASGLKLLAEQPLAVLNRLIQLDPGFGPAYAWRGRMNELLGRIGDADADFDRGCALAPETAVVWFLRGTHRIHRYMEGREAGATYTARNGVILVPWAAETPEGRMRMQEGLADLERMRAAEEGDPLVGPDEVHYARALVAYHQGRREGFEESLRLLQGSNRPEAGRVRVFALYALGRFAEAVEASERALSRWPEDFGLWLQRGLSCQCLGHGYAAEGGDPTPWLEKAAEAFGWAIRKHADCAAAYLGFATARGGMAEAQEARGGDARGTFRAALADVDAALALEPRMPEAWLTRGVCGLGLSEAELAQGGDPSPALTRALADLERGLRYSPELAPGYSDRGLVRVQLARLEESKGGDPTGFYRQAIGDFDEALHRSPGLGAALLNRALALRELGKAEEARGRDARELYGRALADLDAVLAGGGNQTQAWNNRGNVQQRLALAEGARGGDPRELLRKAVTDFGEALRCNAEFAEAWSNRGLARHRLAQADEERDEDPRAGYREAIADLDQALRRNPAMGGAYFNRGNARRRLAEAERQRGADPAENFRLAEADFRAALERHEPSGFLGLGLVYRGLGRYPEAIAAFEALARASPGQARAAREQVAKTRQLLGGAPKTWADCLNAAAQEMQVGKYADARPLYEKGLELFGPAGEGIPEGEREKALADKRLRAFVAAAYYNLACIDAQLAAGKERPRANPQPVDEGSRAGFRAKALARLRAAVHWGFSDLEHARTDKDLAPIRDGPDFEEALTGGK